MKKVLLALAAMTLGATVLIDSKTVTAQELYPPIPPETYSTPISPETYPTVDPVAIITPPPETTPEDLQVRTCFGRAPGGGCLGYCPRGC